MTTITVLVLLVVALVLFVLAAVGIVHARIQLVPFGLAAATLAELVRWWPP